MKAIIELDLELLIPETYAFFQKAESPITVVGVNGHIFSSNFFRLKLDCYEQLCRHRGSVIYAFLIQANEHADALEIMRKGLRDLRAALRAEEQQWRENDDA